MPFLILRDLLRYEDNPDIIATLKRKGWQDRPDPPPYDPATHEANWINGQWVISPIVPFVPFEVPAWALRSAVSINNLKTTFANAIAVLSNNAKIIALEKWDKIASIKRDDRLIAHIQQQIGWTDQQMNDLFVEAYDIGKNN